MTLTKLQIRLQLSPKKEVFKSGTTNNIDGKRVEPGDELVIQNNLHKYNRRKG